MVDGGWERIFSINRNSNHSISLFVHTSIILSTHPISNSLIHSFTNISIYPSIYPFVNLPSIHLSIPYLLLLHSFLHSPYFPSIHHSFFSTSANTPVHNAGLILEDFMEKRWSEISNNSNNNNNINNNNSNNNNNSFNSNSNTSLHSNGDVNPPGAKEGKKRLTL